MVSRVMQRARCTAHSSFCPSSKTPTGNRHNRFKELRRHGVPSSELRLPPVHRRDSGACQDTPGVQHALRNDYFDSVGLPRLLASAQV